MTSPFIKMLQMIWVLWMISEGALEWKNNNFSFSFLGEA